MDAGALDAGAGGEDVPRDLAREEFMSDVIGDVRRALGRQKPLERAPTPPGIDERIVRLVQSEVGLPELFVAQAKKSAMGAELVHADELLDKLIAFLRLHQLTKIAIPISPLLNGLQIQQGLERAELNVQTWNDLNTNAIYDFDCGLTDVYAAVAETGSLVVRPSAEHGRLLSLVPPVHVAIVEPRLIVADLVDLMQKLSRETKRTGATLITGPSKTSDIEGNLVTGVHGPKLVQVFVLN
jgi:L-lactate utilization protein LutC